MRDGRIWWNSTGCSRPVWKTRAGIPDADALCDGIVLDAAGPYGKPEPSIPDADAVGGDDVRN